MKRKTSHWVLLALALSTVLLLAVCGASGSAAEGSQQEESVTGTINRLDSVLRTGSPNLPWLAQTD